MAELRYPIGIQTFSEIIDRGYTYVDKTAYIPKLENSGKYIFLSRPRRFGKSLLLSTLQAYFEGRRELFKGLALDNLAVDWTPYPVLRFDFNPENYQSEEGLERRLDAMLREYEAVFGRDENDVTPAQRLIRLIRSAHQITGRRAVILVDEYDKPLLGIEENPELFEKNQSVLKGFYGVLKSNDEHIHFAFLTGVAKFNRVSVFSDLNNLRDISMTNEFADICGWTENELTSVFRSGIESMAIELGLSYDETVDELRRYYDGYLFAERGSRLYNPFSVLNALSDRKLNDYWYETGTPTFLAKRVRKYGIDPSRLNHAQSSASQLMSVALNMENPIPLMFQTGYLTIETCKVRGGQMIYTLRFPNREVELGFAKNLLPLYVPKADDSRSEFNYFKFVDELYDGQPEAFMKRLAALMKSLPGQDNRESTYRAVTYLLCVLTGAHTYAERESYKGRSDLEVETPDFIYLFEFKYNRSLEEAKNQIEDRDYAGRHAVDKRPVYLIAANFINRKDERRLEYEIDRL